MNDLNFLKLDLHSETQRCIELVNSQVFVQPQIFTQSAFIEILIRLDFILQELSRRDMRITWFDDIHINQKIKDITDLVNYLRNAACHSDSPRNYISNSNTRFMFNIFIGRCPNAIQIGNTFLGNDYQDDIAFYYGDKRIYLVRHIKRLLEELPSRINKLHK